MPDIESYQPLDLDRHPEFTPALLHDKDLLVVPSQGEHGTKVLVGQEGEMLYEQRQAGEATKPQPGVFVSRTAPPAAEARYHRELFGERVPQWKTTAARRDGVPLDRLILDDPALLGELGELEGSPALYGFNQTEEMAEIADRLGLPYYGNPDFAEWAGTKIGLSEFAAECGVETPLTLPVYEAAELPDALAALREAGYDEATVKVSHSTGAMGQTVFRLDQVCRGGQDWSRLMPPEFMSSEGAVVQGWVPDGELVSLHAFVDFDDRCHFTGAQAQLVTDERPPGSSGVIPLDERHLGPVLAAGRRLADGYVRHRAYGPHAMDMIIPGPVACERLGLEPDTVLCHDENTRSSAAMISRAWMLALTEGECGVGWKDTKVKLPSGATIGAVIEALRRQGLLITETGPEAHGVFAYNGAVLDSGHESACYLLALSGRGDQSEAAALVDEAARCLGGRQADQTVGNPEGAPAA